ncbi:hypothetical protein [Polymorphospora rubra]|uniref:Uncharacterized protein n=1 Tax=Polymorphospora rubra TaxID=338584 RepID=A0A810MXW6_9ACTN|nr:hypothetical protein [Polymorphospora rubra]BCJ65334.1 hypothetical protein Prubr_23550 [Polymorphospora rubra]
MIGSASRFAGYGAGAGRAVGRERPTDGRPAVGRGRTAGRLADRLGLVARWVLVARLRLVATPIRADDRDQLGA